MIVLVAGVAPLLEAVTTKLNVPAISVDDSDVMVIEPSAPVIALDQPADDTASMTDPPGTCGPTPSGYVPGPRTFASDNVMIVAAVVLDWSPPTTYPPATAWPTNETDGLLATNAAPSIFAVI